GAAPHFHDDSRRGPVAPRPPPFERIRDHVLLPFASALPEADTRLAPRLRDDTLESIVAAVPEGWLAAGDIEPDAMRRIYVQYLSSRLRSRHIFVEEAIRARSHLWPRDHSRRTDMRSRGYSHRRLVLALDQ